MVDAIVRALSGETSLGCPADLLEDPEELAAFVTSSRFRSYCSTRGVDPEPYGALSAGRVVVRLFEDFVEGALWDPTFIVDFPVETSPLSKARADDPRFADRFELFLGGLEVANGYSEVNDPMDQRKRFEEQRAQRQRGDHEAHQMDEDYIRALGHGLPPTGGCGVGVDRLAMVLTDSRAIRDVILFPHMRPEGGRERKDRPETTTAD
jgi:lysyl-tRNA synthetase class II